MIHSLSNVISPSLSRRSPELVSPYIQIPDNVNTFEFDTYLIDECFVLNNITGYIFKQTINEIGFELDERDIRFWI